MHWMGQNASEPMIKRWKIAPIKFTPRTIHMSSLAHGEGVHIFTYNNTHIKVYFVSLLKAKK